MRLTALDIKKQEFSKAFRGFDKLEVSAFLEIVAEEFEQLLGLNEGQKEKIKELEKSLENYKKMEESWQNTLVTVQKSLDEAKMAVQKESQLILREAQLQKEQILKEAEKEVYSLRQKIARLQELKQEFLTHFKAFLDNQDNVLDNFAQDKKIEKIVEQTFSELERVEKEDLPDTEV